MKRVLYVFGATCLLFGCEQVDSLKDSMFGEQVAQKPPETEPPEASTPDPDLPTEVVPLPEAPPPDPEPERPAPPPKPEPTGPIQPKPSRELLRLVSNWRAIPHSAFPRQVTLNRPLDFIVRDSSGSRVGGVQTPAGSQIVAFEQVGDLLSVGPSLASPMRTLVSMDATDLKLVLTYAYELTKLRQAEITMTGAPRPTVGVTPRRPAAPRPPPATKPRPSTTSTRPPATKPRPPATSTRPPTPKAKPTPRPTRTPKPNSKPLFEDVPTPKDLGHGKWCVCRDCRTRRGAGRGGVLYPNQ